ncbi:WD40-repeat-containing domain protein [Salix suchowensis]|nr:WD40-repeat-containing domain protein [Salix suchowensis]
MSFFGSSTGAAAVNTSNSTAAEKDIEVEVADPPSDSISSLSFSGQADYLAAGSWDNNVSRLWTCLRVVSSSLTRSCRSQVRIYEEGNKIISGGADNVARMFDVTTGQAAPVAQHDAPRRFTARTLLYYGRPVPPNGCRHSRATHTDIQPDQPHLALQATTSGFAVGSVEGRVASIALPANTSIRDNFSFKCHRRDSSANIKDQALVYAVNDISFHPVHGTFSTCGSDGGIHFWDKDARSRLKCKRGPLPIFLVFNASIHAAFDTAPGPISATTFNRNGSIFAYAISYDWSKGHSGMTPGHPNKIMLHACKDDEVKKRQKK